jgi:hypothetical protein
MIANVVVNLYANCFNTIAQTGSDIPAPASQAETETDNA